MQRSANRADRYLEKLEWTVLRRLDGLFQGDYRTLFRGVGLDLAGLREYQPGDDVRFIDWNVTARLQVPYIREYNEDRELDAWFLLDVSPSVDFGSQGVSKRRVLIDATAILSRILSRHGNRVGAVIYGDGVERIIPPGRGRPQVVRLMSELEKAPLRQAARATQLADLIGTAQSAIRRNSLVFLISDFVSQPGWERPLGRLVDRNEVVAVRLFDPMETELPDVGIMTFADAETGDQVVVDSHSKSVRERFARFAAAHDQSVRASLGQAGVDTMEISTVDDLAQSILRFAALRKQRSLLAAGAGDLRGRDRRGG